MAVVVANAGPTDPHRVVDRLMAAVAERHPDADVAWVLTEPAASATADDTVRRSLGPLDALDALEDIEVELICAGLRPDQIAWVGVAAGATAMTEYLARHPTRWGALLAIDVVSHDQVVPPTPVDGSFNGMPAYFTVSTESDGAPLLEARRMVRAYEAAEAHVLVDVIPRGHDHLDERGIARMADMLNPPLSPHRP